MSNPSFFLIAFLSVFYCSVGAAETPTSDGTESPDFQLNDQTFRFKDEQKRHSTIRVLVPTFQKYGMDLSNKDKAKIDQINHMLSNLPDHGVSLITELKVFLPVSGMKLAKSDITSVELRSGPHEAILRLNYERELFSKPYGSEIGTIDIPATLVGKSDWIVIDSGDFQPETDESPFLFTTHIKANRMDDKCRALVALGAKGVTVSPDP